MKETKDVEPSVLVLIVRTNGDEDVAVEAFRSDARNYPKPFTKEVHAGRGLRVLPGKAPSTVALGQHHKIQQAVRYINDNYRTDIRLEGVAGEAGMSPSHFSRIFRKVMGTSYQAYLNSCRITKAKNLLRTSPRSVTEIAISVGFADSTGFGRIFKKLTGQTPSTYRGLSRK
jgi:transcriptional regulator GlxA family with amidase domain